MKGFVLGFVFLFSLPLCAGVLINEVMYNPEGSDSGREWIEIYNNNSVNVNIEDWKFLEANSRHSLNIIQGSLILPINGFAVIADEADTFLSEYENFSGTLIDSSWSSLSNSGEALVLLDADNVVIDNITYETELADGNGKSLERFFYGWNESNTIGGSPGKENNATIVEIVQEIEDNETGDGGTNENENQTIEDPPDLNETEDEESDDQEINEPKENLGISIESNLDDILFVSVEYTSLFEIENLDHVTGITSDINVTIGYNITGNNETINGIVLIESLNKRKTANTGLFAPEALGNYTITGWIIDTTANDSNTEDNIAVKTVVVEDTRSINCDVKINITTNQTIFNEGESIKFSNNLNNESFPYTIEYWIDDFFNDTRKNKVNTTNTNKKSWKTRIDEQDRVLFVKANVYPLCNDTNVTDNSAELLFIVKSTGGEEKPETSDEGSIVKISDADSSANFGDIVSVDLELYKGDTRKQVIEFWIEGKGKRVSEKSKIKLLDKFTALDATFPIQLKDNCDSKFKTGSYDIVVEGLGLDDEDGIRINENKDCHKTSSTVSSKKDFVFELLNFENKINTNTPQVAVHVENNDDKNLNLKLWSYIYRGSKSYSGEREENMEELTLESGENKIVMLQNTLLEETKSGEYKLKVLANKNNQKTNQQITEDVEIAVEEQRSVFEETQSAEEIDKENLQTTSEVIPTGTIIYESSSFKAQKLIIPLLALLSVILNIVLILRR